MTNNSVEDKLTAEEMLCRDSPEATGKTIGQLPESSNVFGTIGLSDPGEVAELLQDRTCRVPGDAGGRRDARRGCADPVLIHGPSIQEIKG